MAAGYTFSTGTLAFSSSTFSICAGPRWSPASTPGRRDRPPRPRRCARRASCKGAATNPGPADPHPTHTALRMPRKLKGRDIMLVADEDVAKLRPSAPAFAWIYDITFETQPMPIATFQVPGLDIDGAPQPPMMGCHQPAERFHGTIVPFAWFARGLRLVDVRDPFAPREVGFYEPGPPEGYEMVSSNDVTVDPSGLMYLIDRQRGLSIIESAVS